MRVWERDGLPTSAVTFIKVVEAQVQRGVAVALALCDRFFCHMGGESAQGKSLTASLRSVIRKERDHFSGRLQLYGF